MKKQIKTFFFLAALLAPVITPVVFAVDRHELSFVIHVYDVVKRKSQAINPHNGYTFEIIGKKGSHYLLKVFDENGNLLGDNFISSREEVENNLMKEEVDAVVKGLASFESTGEGPTDGCSNFELDAVLAEAELLTSEEIGSKVREACQIPGTDAQWQANCDKLFDKGFPDGALEYALNVMKLNAIKFNSKKCIDGEGSKIKYSDHLSMNGLTMDHFKNNVMKNGLPNKCQFIINDTDDRSPSTDNRGCRGQMYYVDLCNGNEPKVVKDYFNIGTGTCGSGRYGFMNESRKKTTLLGAFFTHTDTFDFTDATRQVPEYRALSRRVERAGGPRKAVALNMFGLQQSNNKSSHNGKYIHVSPWASSSGCPSVRAENYYMIEALANGGPSLILNYSKDNMEPIESCTEITNGNLADAN